MRLNVLLALARFHQGKTGDFQAATVCYGEVISATVGTRDPALRNLKAEALRNLGVLYYTRKHDLDEAVIKLTDSLDVSPKAETADVLSQILFRLARDPKRSEAARAAQLAKALEIARLGQQLDQENADRASTPGRRAKLALQVAIVLEALGKGEEAAQVWSAPLAEGLGNDGLYQLALLRALRRAPADEVAGPLQRALELRQEPAARNQIRWFVRTEPDLQRYAQDPSWSALVSDE